LHTARLRRLALAADDAMVNEARTRVDRVHHIVTLTRPAAEPDTNKHAPVDMAEDMTGVSGVDTNTVRQDMSARTSPPPHVRTPKPSGRTRRGTDTATAVTQLRTAHPDMTAGEIAARIGVTDRTVRRHLPKPEPAAAPAVMNGHPTHTTPDREEEN
ncbi:MAG: helix-turn-helix domain-containing protein, partial [Stackebrandtia sp.]